MEFLIDGVAIDTKTTVASVLGKHPSFGEALKNANVEIDDKESMNEAVLKMFKEWYKNLYEGFYNDMPARVRFDWLKDNLDDEVTFSYDYKNCYAQLAKVQETPFNAARGKSYGTNQIYYMFRSVVEAETLNPLQGESAFVGIPFSNSTKERNSKGTYFSSKNSGDVVRLDVSIVETKKSKKIFNRVVDLKDSIKGSDTLPKDLEQEIELFWEKHSKVLPRIGNSNIERRALVVKYFKSKVEFLAEYKIPQAMDAADVARANAYFAKTEEQKAAMSLQTRQELMEAQRAKTIAENPEIKEYKSKLRIKVDKRTKELMDMFGLSFLDARNAAVQESKEGLI